VAFAFCIHSTAACRFSRSCSRIVMMLEKDRMPDWPMLLLLPWPLSRPIATITLIRNVQRSCEFNTLYLGRREPRLHQERGCLFVSLSIGFISERLKCCNTFELTIVTHQSHLYVGFERIFLRSAASQLDTQLVSDSGALMALFASLIEHSSTINNSYL